MHAIIVTGGKQYKVAEGDVVYIEKLDQEAGDIVKFDQVLAIIEAMKMETSITAPMKGEVKEVLINQGQSVKAGELLIVME